MNRYFVVVPLLMLVLMGQQANGEQLDLEFNAGVGTYNVPITIPGVGMRKVTFDTGASYTVLDKTELSLLNLREESQAMVYLPHEGIIRSATFVTLPQLIIGTCVLRKRKVVVLDIPNGRTGALGMNDLEEMAPFTFTGDGKLEFRCPTK